MRVVILSALLIFVRIVHADSLDGVWKSSGYGYVFAIRGSQLKAFQVTSATCVPGFTARAKTIDVPGRDVTFKTNEKDVFLIRAQKPTDNGPFRRLHFEGAASDIVIRRAEGIPGVCTPPTANTPVGNFDVFVHTFEEQYIAFDLKHADWKKIVAENRPKVTNQTGAAQLFAILQAMIEPFHDAHTALNAPSLNRAFEGFRPGGYQLDEGKSEAAFQKHEMPKLLAITEQNYLDGPIASFCKGQLQYGHVSSTTGYLRVLAEGGYTRNKGPAAELATLDAALDSIFSDVQLKKLILDVRVNFGGSDQLGLAIAVRLTKTPYPAFTKFARLFTPAEPAAWTAGQTSIVSPVSRPSFTGPVVELIGPLTVSAGETLTQALMGRTPHITRIGENTQGVFSDVLDRRLPNGWGFGLPNEVFRTSEGKAFDSVGIPPDLRIPVFAAVDVKNRRDPALEKALEVLGDKQNKHVHNSLER
jgi:hypothetical protein